MAAKLASIFCVSPSLASAVRAKWPEESHIVPIYCSAIKKGASELACTFSFIRSIYQSASSAFPCKTSSRKIAHIFSGSSKQGLWADSAKV